MQKVEPKTEAVVMKMEALPAAPQTARESALWQFFDADPSITDPLDGNFPFMRCPSFPSTKRHTRSVRGDEFEVPVNCSAIRSSCHIYREIQPQSRIEKSRVVRRKCPPNEYNDLCRLLARRYRLIHTQRGIIL